jgi:hypothetical protein
MTAPATLLDQVLPSFDVFEHHERIVDAPPDEVWRAVEHFGMGASPVLRVLGFLRRPSRAALHGAPAAPEGVERSLVRRGFTRLAGTPGEEVVLGLAGRFWRPRPDVVALATPEDFADFAREGFAKAVMNVHVEPAGAGTRLSTETRVLVFGTSARRRFRAYWLVVGPFSALIRRDLLRRLAAACG